jgi:site-specific DNA-cytosine methylase
MNIMAIRYLSVCSGIEAATVAWKPLGWEAAAFSDIEPFPRELLQHHYPDTPLHGDFTTIGENDYGSINLLVGGTPCQAFSVAGLRRGYKDHRGNLTLAFLQLLKRKNPKWVVWENVSGVLSHDKGRTFGAFLGGLGQLGYGFAYRVLDAQYFGVPQRRRRVFVVGRFRDWRSPAKVLFEPESLSGDITPLLSRFIRGRRKNLSGNICTRVNQHGRKDLDTLIFDYILNRVRVLTPLEIERCFGFPDNYTNIPNSTDAKRTAALGNSIAPPVMRWIGERIQKVGSE